jgi:hypothetical protein
MKKVTEWSWALLAALIFSICGVAAGPAVAEPAAPAATATPAAEASQIALVEPAAGAEVSQLNAAQKAYLALPRQERVEFFADPEKREQLVEKAGYYPQPISFSWQWAGHDGAECTLHVAANQDFSKERTVTTKEGKVSLDNLRIHTRYYWKVTAKTADGQSATSRARTFTTADEAPRLIRIDGVPNVRDFGGRKAMDGKRVKQDLVFRTAGLNDNAGTIYEDEQAVLDRDNGRLRKVKAQLQAKIAALKEQVKNPAEIDYVPFSLTPSWSVFRPAKTTLDGADLAAIEQLATVPEELLGAKREKAVMDQDGRFAFDTPAVKALSVFMQEFTAPSDGVMQIGCGGDWFWDFRINGVKVYDKLQGNGISPAAASNYIFNIQVKKGKNLAVVVLLNVSAGGSWCCAERPRVPIKTILENQIKNDEQSIKSMAKVVKGLEPGKNRLNDDMKKYMLDYLGIRTDIDLRSDRECYGMTGSPLGPTVAWVHNSSWSYQGLLTKEGKEAFAKSFKIFCDKKNYPIVFHCIAGQDRTGSLAFVLNGLLGVDEEELYKDWEISGFWNQDPELSHRERFDKLVDGFKANFPQPTWRGKMEAYVKSLGFTQEDIDRFRSIMLEEDK